MNLYLITVTDIDGRVSEVDMDDYDKFRLSPVSENPYRNAVDYKQLDQCVTFLHTRPATDKIEIKLVNGQ